MNVYAIMSDMQEDGYYLCDIKSSFELAKKQVEDNGPSEHGDMDVVEWEVDGDTDDVTVFTLPKNGSRRKAWTHPKFKT